MSILENGKPDRTAKRQLHVKPQRDDFTKDLLTDAEKEQICKEAREDFEAEQKKKQADRFYADEMEALRRAGDPLEARVPIFLQLPGNANCIMLDGKQYFTDTVYNDVPIKTAHVLIEQMNRAWAHEEITEVRTARGRRQWRPPPGIGFGNFMDNRIPRNLTLSTEELAGAVTQMQRTVHG